MIATWWSYFLGLLGVVVVLLYKFFTRKNNYWKDRNVPEIKPIPIIGSLLPILMLKKTIGEWLWDNYNKLKSDYIGIFIFDRPGLIIKSPKLVKTILQKDFNYFQDRTIIHNDYDPILGNLIFFQKNPLWKPTRAKLSPIFTSGKLKAMFPVVLHETENMRNYISKPVPTFDVKEISAKYSTNVVTRCAFGIEANSFKDDNAEFRKLTRQLFGFRLSTAFRQLGSWFAPNVYKLFNISFFDTKIISMLKEILKETMKIKKQSAVRTTNLIDSLIETKRKTDDPTLTDDGIMSHSLQFFGAGFETISATVGFTFYELALHPEIQERLRAEVQERFERDNGNITYAAIHEMQYLDMVVCETLRKYPPLPFLDRTCKADYKVEDSDLIIEKGTPVYISLFGLHYDENYFPNPEEYDPERFADKSLINNEGMFYIPFGEGPRVCIGERFGLQVVKLAITSILLKFRIEKCDKTPAKAKFDPMSIVLFPKPGLPVTFVPL